MSNKKEVHTPLPWRVGNGFIVNKDGWAIVELDDRIQINLDWIEKNPQKHWANGPINIASRDIDVEESVANTALIIKAVNCHYELLEACEEALLLIDQPQQVGYRGQETSARTALFNAITKAKGE